MKSLFLIMCVLTAISTRDKYDMSMNILLAIMSLGFAILAIYVWKLEGADDE